MRYTRLIIALCIYISTHAQKTHKQIYEKGITGKFVKADSLKPEKLIGDYQLLDGRDTIMPAPLEISGGPYIAPMRTFVMQDGQWQPMRSDAYRDTTFNPNDTLKRDSTLGIALFIDTLFTLQSAICLRIRESKRHSYGKGWFYDDPATESYLSLVDGVWVPDLDDRLFLIFVPRKQFQDGKKKGVNEK